MIGQYALIENTYYFLPLCDRPKINMVFLLNALKFRFCIAEQICNSQFYIAFIHLYGFTKWKIHLDILIVDVACHSNQW